MTYTLIPRSEIPAPSSGYVPAHRDALELALAHPDQAVPVFAITQREKARLVQIVSPKAKGKYAGKLKATVVRMGKDDYNVFLEAVIAEPLNEGAPSTL